MSKQSLFILGDLHAPYHHPAALEQVLKAIEVAKPTHVVQLGDLYDFYAFSNYPKSVNHDTPKLEISKGHRVTTRMWERISHIVPNAKKFQLLGNHDVRLRKRISERLPEAAGLSLDRSLFEFPGVDTMLSDRDALELTINGERLVVHHGFLGKLGDHIAHFNRSVITGHSHRPGVVFLKTHRKTLWELNAGYLGDERRHVFKYGATNVTKWARAYGIVDALGPRVVPLG